ncbi:hypothetical protein C5B42_03915 [Candidatus Cerribacteria bacterium 'Amazon FNV 2010 28 9']|uniref:ChbG/HpnK family deacetylase n=1 Tax=Candidatus Cerribacteria bacterium 'Amazon FNV 2010 28 9' TaxID=2081795 RepID=A0A317JPT0_9BACT|nr:MAG: hypothetical protein C5B42_03915 [Candidatus Cerribacteria bacterium 'Amazon FNV 2010 28 9']
MKAITINADDFGMSQEINAGIKQGIEAGVLTSVSIMTNMPFFEDAVRFLKKHPEIYVGLHFNITEGTPVSPLNKVGLLLREDNHFFSWVLIASRLFISVHAVKDIQTELLAQYEKLEKTGLKISHIDSHHHIHLHSRIFPIVISLAKRKGVKALRCRRFNIWNITNGIKIIPNLKQMIILSLCLYNNIRYRQYKELFSTDALYDLNWDNCISEKKLLSIFNHLPDGITGIICHPATMSKTGNKMFLTPRFHCLQLMLKPSIRKKILEYKLTKEMNIQRDQFLQQVILSSQ